MKFAMFLVAVLGISGIYAADQSADNVLVAVASQAAMSRQFLLSFEKIMIAQHFLQAGSTYLNLFAQPIQTANAGIVVDPLLGVVAHPAVGGPVVAAAPVFDDSDDEESDTAAAESTQADDSDLEEDVSFLEMKEVVNSASDANQALIASYNLFSGIKRWLHVTVFTAGDVQANYWADRALQIQASSLGSAVPAQLSQFLYLRAFRNQLQTLSFASKLQTISHFTMWLEDEIDAGVLLAHPGLRLNAAQKEELYTDRLYAFHAYNTFAQLELYTFYIDMYLNSILASLSQPHADNAAFLETETEEKPFFPFMLGAAAANGQGFGQFAIWINFYRVLLQMQAAQSGLTSAMSEQLYYEKKATNPKEAENHFTFARQSFAGFGHALAQMSQVDMWLGMIGLWQIYAPAQQAAANANASANNQ